MSLFPPRGRVRAILGPTNTGKTHFAIDRMLGHASGMIGFPLRLLARENYDRIVKAKGRRAVALITGEEKIVPPNPRWFVCTVESMPLDRLVDFLAIDEIQLCADADRGHVFTDRLLHARGREETLFLGSDTVRGVLRQIVPEAEIESRPRFSVLTYTGSRKLTRLPRRSAVVAFSVDQVYALAEQVRRQRGGTAVVLGALSPRTRNAQVALYQSGEVDYMVATDAIGMGLNMDVDHVAFAGLRKFDGRRPRPLTQAEIGQIAGRAGRHMNNGSFGVTQDVPPLDPETVEAVETHRFEPVRKLFWRTRKLDFRSPRLLLRSLEALPSRPELIRAREADDQLALAALTRDERISAYATTPDTVRLLWEVCQIPDFRKVLADQHARLLRRIYLHLAGSQARLPEDWVAAQIGQLDSTSGDIDTLTNRIAYIRTWTYISHRADWLANAVHWQDRARDIEDRLSDALHDRLTQRFVDRRAAMLGRKRDAGDTLLAGVTAAGGVIVEGHPVGRVEGLAFRPDAGLDRGDSKAALAAARCALAQDVGHRVARLAADGDGAFSLTPAGRIVWQDAEVGRLLPGDSPLAPRIEVLRNDLLDNGLRERVRQRLAAWLDTTLRRRLAPLYRARDADLGGPARGLVYQLCEGLGSLPRATAKPMLADIDQRDRKFLSGLGLRFGALSIHFAGLLRPRAVALRATLWSVHAGQPAPSFPKGDAASLPAGELPASFWMAAGYRRIGRRALRLDRLERLHAAARKRARQGPFAATPDLTALAGCDGAELAAILTGLGFRAMESEGGLLFRSKSRPPQRKGKNMSNGKSRKGQGDGGTSQDTAGRKPAAPRHRRADPNSPFARLRDLVPAK